MRLFDQADEAEAKLVGARRLLSYCDSPETPKAKKLKRLQESAEPLLRLRDERQQHFAAACPAAKMQSEVRSKLDERS